MKITWLGHSGFRIETGAAVVLIDPWLTGNPMFPEDRRAEATRGATHVLVSHGHGDHSGDALAIAKADGVPCVGIYDLMSHWEATEGIQVIGFNKGGTVDLAGVKVTMVNAVHSSSLGSDNGPIYAGAESGYVLDDGTHRVYFSGDTDVMADMQIIQDLHEPDIGILCAGGHFTMDMARAAYACKTFFDFRTVIPCHYRTFPLLEQSAAVLASALPSVDVIEPQVLEPITL